MKKNALFICFLILFSTQFSYAQNTILINASKVKEPVISYPFDMGNPGHEGKEIRINNLYMTIGGKPVIPVMGEMHFSRVPRQNWQDILLKMKAAGITIVSTYIFWIHHEEIEGQFNWSGNRDLRAFLKLCKKDGLYAFVRIGPWSHGEVRNGGFPDWLLEKKYIHPRSNDPVYQQYVGQYFKQIALQMNGLLYKDGGPVIGIQLENEYSGGKEGNKYISWLKKTAINDGMDVPFYAVTGWGNASIPKDQVIPLWAGYPGAPWNPNLKKITENPSFVFGDSRSSGNVYQGTTSKRYHTDTKRYPFFTVELGLGNEITYHRRPLFSPIDGLTIATAKLGSGANMLGYYMFAGGSNPVGELSTMEENRNQTGYWNRYPIISYDFQTAIKETGELSPSYYQVKKLHYFIDEFGSQLAPMMPVIGPQKDPHKNLLYSVRTKGKSGYLFGINYYRGYEKPEHRNVRFDIALKHEHLIFPKNPVNIPDSSIFIWPFNLQLKNVLLRYATAQPLCKIVQNGTINWYFVQNKGILPEFSFAASTVGKIETTSGTIHREQNGFLVTGLQPGIDAVINLQDKQGRNEKIHILTYEESLHVWLFHHDGKKQLYLSDDNLYLKQNELHVYGPSNHMKVIVLCGQEGLTADGKSLQEHRVSHFPEYEMSVPARHINLTLKSNSILSNVKWLEASKNKITPGKELGHKFFLKEFNLGNPSGVKSATLYLAPQIPCKLKINHRWINQKIVPGELNKLDLTGYVHEGNNMLMLDFPYVEGDSAFAAKLEVEYANSDKVTFSSNKSWLTFDSYTIPASWSRITGLVAPTLAFPGNIRGLGDVGPKEWTMRIPENYLEGLNNLYLHISYIGDRARCRLHYRLIWDNFNDNTPWHLALKRFGNQISGQKLKFTVYPLKPGYKIYFDKKPRPNEIGKAEISRVKVVPEYSVNWTLNR